MPLILSGGDSKENIDVQMITVAKDLDCLEQVRVVEKVRRLSNNTQQINGKEKKECLIILTSCSEKKRI